MALFTCSVCLEDDLDAATQRGVMPCCRRPDSTTSICRQCQQALIPARPRVGRCPFCRTHLQWLDGPGGDLEVARGAGQCRVCGQHRLLVTPNVCDACEVGLHVVLRYECDRCHRVAAIPHPMYRYQRTPEAFSDDTWFCAHCGDQTKRRIIPEDIPRVPPEDAPDTWGLADEVLARARQRVLAGRAERAARPHHWRDSIPVVVAALVLAYFSATR
jgi:hypothetical protein